MPHRRATSKCPSSCRLTSNKMAAKNAANVYNKDKENS